MAARVLGLQRTVGNRGVARLLGGRRGVARAPVAPPVATPLEPGLELNLRAAEEAQIEAGIQRLLAARVLTDDEIEEVEGLYSLEAITGPTGIGTLKLTRAVQGPLKSMLVGSPAEYVRDPMSLAAHFVKGDPADPDSSVTVTSSGLIYVERTVRTQHKAPKGKPAPPPTLSYVGKLVDLRGREVRVGKDEQPLDVVYAGALAEVTGPLQKSALDELGGLDTPVAGAGGEKHLTLGQVVAEADPSVYVQRAIVGRGDNARQSDLAEKVQAAFDQLRSEFATYEAGRVAAVAKGVTPPTHEELVTGFADRAQPKFAEAVAAAQSELDQKNAAVAEAQGELDAANAALTALRATKPTTKQERLALQQRVKEAGVRQQTALKALTRAKQATRRPAAVLAEMTKQRDAFRADIAYLLDPKRTTATIAADSVGSLCNVLSYFLYGKAVGVVPPDTDFKDYYLAEVKAGRISSAKASDSRKGFYLGTGSIEWAAARGLRQGAKWDDDHPLLPLGDPSRRQELITFLESDINLAVSHQDLDHTPPRKPHHFLLIIKDKNGVWRNLDHTATSYQRRGGITDWNRVYRIDADEALLQEARRKLEQ